MSLISPTPSVMIATPCYGSQLSEGYFHSILRTIAFARKNQFKVHVNTLGNKSLISRARNTLVAQFLDLIQQENINLTHLLFIDADIAFTGETVFRLVASDIDFVCGLYPKKTIHWKKIQNNKQSEDVRQLGLNYNVNFFKEERIDANNGFAKVKEAASGFMCVKKEVILKLIQAYPELHYQSDQQIGSEISKSNNHYALFDTLLDKKDNRYLSEDYAFCKRWRDIGGSIYVDLNSKLTHYGYYGFEGDFTKKLRSHS